MVGGDGSVAADAGVGSDGVVVAAECVEVFLQCGDGSDVVVSLQEDFHGFPDAFDFALGGGFVGAPIFLDDALDGEECFEGIFAASAVASAGVTGGEDHAVVGEGGVGWSVVVDGVVERVGHCFAGYSAVGGEVEKVAGVVVDPADDFAVEVVGVPVGEVGLPQTVGLWCGEELVGGAGSFLGLLGDASGGFEDPPNGGGADVDVVLGEVVGDGVCSGIEAFRGECVT